MNEVLEPVVENDEAAIREGLLRLAQTQAGVAQAGSIIFAATYTVEIVGTTGKLRCNLDCANGVKLRFEGVHNSVPSAGAIAGAAAGFLDVDPASLVGKDVDYVFAVIGGLISAINVTWISTGNMTGIGFGIATIPPSIGRGKFTRRS